MDGTLPLYEFQSAEDPTVFAERFYHASEAPDLGSVVMIDKTPFVRIVSVPQISGFVAYTGQYPKVSSTLPKFCDGADHVKTGREKGKPIIRNVTHERELCRMYGFTREYSEND